MLTGPYWHTISRIAVVVSDIWIFMGMPEKEGEPSELSLQPRIGNAKIPVAVNPKTPKRLENRCKNLPRFEKKIIGIYPGKNVPYHVLYKCGWFLQKHPLKMFGAAQAIRLTLSAGGLH